MFYRVPSNNDISLWIEIDDIDTFCSWMVSMVFFWRKSP